MDETKQQEHEVDRYERVPEDGGSSEVLVVRNQSERCRLPEPPVDQLIRHIRSSWLQRGGIAQVG